jgi:hypothetical protein
MPSYNDAAPPRTQFSILYRSLLQSDELPLRFLVSDRRIAEIFAEEGISFGQAKKTRRRKRDTSGIDKVGGLDSGSGLLGTASDLALREFSWATCGPISRFESEPFGDLVLPLGTACP